MYADAAASRRPPAARRSDPDGSLRLGQTTLLRADGTATYQLASVADDLALGITHVIRGSDHRPNEDLQRRIARAVGGELPEVSHIGLLLGDDGKKLSKRHGGARSRISGERAFPPRPLRSYLDELGLPAHDVRLDRGRIGRLAIDAITAMPDDELAAAADAPLELARALRGARTLVEAREMARAILSPDAGGAGRRGTTDARAVRRVPRRGARRRSTRSERERSCASSRPSEATCGSLRLALTGPSAGPSCGRSSPPLPADEALARVGRACPCPTEVGRLSDTRSRSTIAPCACRTR